MTKGKFNFDANASQLMATADKIADSRWNVAEKIVADHPTGLPTASTVELAKPSDQNLSVGQNQAAVAVAATLDAPDVIMAEISKTRDNPRNARKLYDPEVVNQRAISLRRDGQMTPAPACLDWENPGGFIMIGGHYRKKGLLQNGESHIQLKLLPCATYAELYRLSYAENEERQSGTPLDDAMSWRELLDCGDVKSQDEIAAMVSKPRTTINKTLALLNLQPAVLEILKQSPSRFTLTAGYELSVMSPLFDENELMGIAQQVAQGEVSSRELTAMKDRRKNAKPRSKKLFSRQHKITMPGTANGLIKDWDTGRVVLEIVIADAVERERLVNDLRARLCVLTPPSLVSEPDAAMQAPEGTPASPAASERIDGVSDSSLDPGKALN